jgi:hypothetical protein
MPVPVLARGNVDVPLTIDSQISLDNGIVEYTGDASSFASSPFYKGVLLLEGEEVRPEPTAAEDVVVEDVFFSETTKPAAALEAAVLTAKKPCKLIQQEKREAGSVSLDTYKMFLSACVCASAAAYRAEKC